MGCWTENAVRNCLLFKECSIEPYCLMCLQWRLVVAFAGGAASHFLIFLHSLQAVYLPLFCYKCANFSKLCAVLVV